MDLDPEKVECSPCLGKQSCRANPSLTSPGGFGSRCFPAFRQLLRPSCQVDQGIHLDYNTSPLKVSKGAP